MEEINLNLGSPTQKVESGSTIKINIDDTPKKSVNFGPGAEMLMNQSKNKVSSPRADINLSDLNELDNISLNEEPKKKRPSFTDVTSNIFDSPKSTVPMSGISLKIDEMKPEPLKQATTLPKVETDDGFKTFNEIPVTPTAPPPEKRMSAEAYEGLMSFTEKRNPNWYKQ